MRAVRRLLIRKRGVSDHHASGPREGESQPKEDNSCPGDPLGSSDVSGLVFVSERVSTRALESIDSEEKCVNEVTFI